MRKQTFEALSAWQARKDAGEQVGPFRLQSDNNPDGIPLHKFYVATIGKSTETEYEPEEVAKIQRATGADEAAIRARTRSFTVSTATVDREKDTIAVKGWKLDNYKRNPVVLWAHNYRELPLGKSLKCKVDGAALRSEDYFAERDVYDLADTVLRMLDLGLLNAVSVGFDPLKWRVAEERMDENDWWPPVDFLEQEKLEHSVVPVPANPDALMDAKALGVDIAPIAKWAEQTLEELHGEGGMWLPRSFVERALRVADTKTVHGGVDLPAAKTEEEPPVNLEERIAQLEAEIAGIKSEKGSGTLTTAAQDRLQQAHTHLMAAADHVQGVLDDCDPMDANDPANGDPNAGVESNAHAGGATKSDESELTPDQIKASMEKWAAEHILQATAAATGRLP